MINVLLWLIFGAVAGFVTSRVIGGFAYNGLLLNGAAGALGALIGGVVFLIFDTTPLNAFNIGGLLVALLGAVLMIVLVRAVTGRTI